MGLDLLSKTGQNIITAAKALVPNQGTLININNTQSHEATNYIDASKATQLIKASGHIPLKENTGALEALYEAHDIEALPEVDARKQTNKGGNEAGNLEALTDIPSEGLKVGHKDRREEELGLDMESDEV